MSEPTYLTHQLLENAGVAHGFGLRASAPLEAWRPRQVHGKRVVEVASVATPACEADGAVSSAPGLAIGVVTADCVPLLLASAGGARVGAVHAGWRGLAAGVVEAGVEAFGSGRAAPAAAVIGPHIGACCYEVDAPVIDALRARFAGAVDPALTPTRAGHARLDLGALVQHALERAADAHVQVARIGGCTRCEPERFHSFRRDGEAAGRLLHWIAAAR